MRTCRTPSLGFDDSDNFYILTEYQDAPTAAGSSTGAVVLQKFDFSAIHAGGGPFTNNEQDPTCPLWRLRRWGVQPEDHLPVVHLGQQ